MEGWMEPFDRKERESFSCTHFNEDIDCTAGQVARPRTGGAR